MELIWNNKLLKEERDNYTKSKKKINDNELKSNGGLLNNLGSFNYENSGLSTFGLGRSSTSSKPKLKSNSDDSDSNSDSDSDNKESHNTNLFKPNANTSTDNQFNDINDIFTNKKSETQNIQHNKIDLISMNDLFSVPNNNKQNVSNDNNFIYDFTKNN